MHRHPGLLTQSPVIQEKPRSSGGERNRPFPARTVGAVLPRVPTPVVRLHLTYYKF
ncbi:MAG: hypothetical protein V3V24_09595 [Nitrospinaceae bacterium]